VRILNFKVKGNKKGSTTVELVMVTLLLFLFGFVIFNLVVTGTSTSERITLNKDAQTDARVITSYLNVRIRQNDTSGAFSIEPHPSRTDIECLVIKTPLESGEHYETWIYTAEKEDHSGNIVSYLVENIKMPYETALNDDLSLSIAPAESLHFFIDSEKDLINYTLEYTYDGTSDKKITETIYLRSDSNQ